MVRVESMNTLNFSQRQTVAQSIWLKYGYWTSMGGFKSHLFHFLDVCLWVSDSTSLSLRLFTHGREANELKQGRH